MNFWAVIYRFAWVTLGVLLFIAILCMFMPQYRQYREYQRRADALQEQIRLEEEMLKTLKQKQERFRSDPRFVEQIAHEVGLARPNETIFRFVEDEGDGGPTVP